MGTIHGFCASSQAMENGGGRVHFYSAEMNEASVRRLQLEVDLRRAIEDREFRLAYQPKVDVATGAVVGAEALVRWYKDDEVLMPGDFIPVAEETGLIVPLGWWVLRESCKQTRIWQEQFPSDPPLWISVNMSGKLFMKADMVDDLLGILEETGLALHRLANADPELGQSLLRGGADRWPDSSTRSARTAWGARP